MVKRYIIRKYVYAESAAEAIKADKKSEVDAVFVDEEWLQQHTIAQMGFNSGNAKPD